MHDSKLEGQASVHQNTDSKDGAEIPHRVPLCEDEVVIPINENNRSFKRGREGKQSKLRASSFQNKRPCGDLDHAAPAVSQSSLNFTADLKVFTASFQRPGPESSREADEPITFILELTSRLILADFDHRLSSNTAKTNLYCHLRTLVILSVLL